MISKIGVEINYTPLLNKRDNKCPIAGFCIFKPFVIKN